MSIGENIQKALSAIDLASEMAGRKKGSVSLVAVTKGCSISALLEAYAFGVRDFGESRVQEALSKIAETPADIRWHFIGRLQKNKVSKVVGRFVLIHSVDTPELAEKIARTSVRMGVKSSILLEANTSGEESKAGNTPKAWKSTFPALLEMEGIEIHGLMTMAPLTEDEGVIRRCFSELRHLRDDLQQAAKERADLSTLSMGMSHDFPLAIQEGATLVRIGSAIFAPR